MNDGNFTLSTCSTPNIIEVMYIILYFTTPKDIIWYFLDIELALLAGNQQVALKLSVIVDSILTFPSGSFGPKAY